MRRVVRGKRWFRAVANIMTTHQVAIPQRLSGIDADSPTRPHSRSMHMFYKHVCTLAYTHAHTCVHTVSGRAYALHMSTHMSTNMSTHMPMRMAILIRQVSIRKIIQAWRKHVGSIPIATQKATLTIISLLIKAVAIRRRQMRDRARKVDHVCRTCVQTCVQTTCV